MKDTNLKVAIVHDWLIGGGAELVVEQLHILYPEAPIYTSYCTPAWRERLHGKVVTGWLQPLGRIRKYLPFLRAWWFSRLDLRQFDLVLSSSGAEAKGVKRLRPGALHINYCHAPTHYYWSRYEQYLKRPGFGVFDPLARFGLKILVGPMRRWDLTAAKRPDIMIANSSYIQSQIKKYYGRDATVIHPPVDTERFAPRTKTERHGFLVTGRQTPYKRIGLAVQACTSLDLPLTVIGNGPDHQRLVKLAGPSITFLTTVSDTNLPKHFQAAFGFIFPGLDDFGIVAVEALAAGTPVLAYEAGGALDYVTPGKTGEFFSAQTVTALSEVLQKFDPDTFDNRAISDSAKAFDAAAFKARLSKLIDAELTRTAGDVAPDQ
ncbi:MAG: glycosyl transferase [Candidatus Saccharibacteria bacterium]|nr:glycosyl transferase [Candidatus Saccharibacteria bacterium]